MNQLENLMSKSAQKSGGNMPPKSFDQGGKVPSNPVPGGIGNNASGMSRGKQGKS